MRFWCCEIFLLKPVLVTFVCAKFNVARKKVQLSFDLGREATLQKSTTRPNLQQLPDTGERGQQSGGRKQNVTPQLIEFRYACHIL